MASFLQRLQQTKDALTTLETVASQSFSDIVLESAGLTLPELPLPSQEEVNEFFIKIGDVGNKLNTLPPTQWSEIQFLEWKRLFRQQAKREKLANESKKSPKKLKEYREKQKAKKALAQIKKINAPTKTEVKSDDEIYPLSRAEQIRSYVESLPQPSVEEIIRNRAAIRTRYSGIGSLNFKEPEFEIESPKSTGLNYLSGFSDEVENSERRKKEKEEENDR